MSGGPRGERIVATSRLLLAPAEVTYLDEVAALHADERVWRHRPEGRHTSLEYTRGKVIEMQRQWSRDGLGYWAAWLRRPVADLPTGAFVGVGGCAVGNGASWWNLYYRLRPEAHGHGLASELCQAALSAARRVKPALPVVASLLEANPASKATAERAGLHLQWRGRDPGEPCAIRLIYADRPVDPELVNAVVSH